MRLVLVGIGVSVSFVLIGFLLFLLFVCCFVVVVEYYFMCLWVGWFLLFVGDLRVS